MAIVGVDIGTQSLKVLVTNDELRPLGAAATPDPLDSPRPGWAEQAPELWDSALGISITKALGAAGCAVGEVRVLGTAEVVGALDDTSKVDPRRTGRGTWPGP